MAKIRKADVPDIKAIVELGYELVKGSVYNVLKIDESKFRMTLAGLMGSKNGIVYVVVDDNNQPQGFLAGVVSEYDFSSDKFATDMWTYVRPKFIASAFMLYKKFIEWAKNKPRIAMIEFAQSSGAGNHDRWCKLMEKLGCERIGSLYMMRLKQCQA